MSSMTVVHQDTHPEEDYDLVAVAGHNAVATTEQYPGYHEDAKGLGIYHAGYTHAYGDEQAYVHHPPTPRSATASEGVRTRSGRSTKRTDSPFSTSHRVSKSPAARPKKDKKGKLDKSKTPKLTAPLSVLTKDMSVPVRDIEAWVNRPAEERRKEVERRNGYITRPMNSFMLYRSAYAERTKQWCLQNNHQVVSSVSGESWPMEPDEVRNQYDEWAKLERANHQAAHPDYKFSPSKSNNKRRKGDFSEDDDDVSDVDGDPDGEYRGGRITRQRKQMQQPEAAFLDGAYGFDSHPYYGQAVHGYDDSQYQYATPGRPLPSNVAYDIHGLAYNPQTNTYLPTMQQQLQYPYLQDRVATPASLNGHSQSLGNFGLPGGQNGAEDQQQPQQFADSRTGTPMQSYIPYGQQPMYQQYPAAQYHPPQVTYQQAAPATPVATAAQMYEHQQYLQQACQPQAAIDPSLHLELGGGGGGGGVTGAMTPGLHLTGSHFDDAMGDMTHGDLAGMHEYYMISPMEGNVPVSHI